MTEPTGTGIGDMVVRYEPQFALVLPPSLPSSMFVRLAEGKLRTDAKLAAAARANPGSLLSALMDCARLGHEPGTNEYALVPFQPSPKDGRQFPPEIVGIEQYQGVIERMLNSGVVLAVQAEVVHEQDYFDPFAGGPYDIPDHRPAWYLDPVGPKRNHWLIPRSHRGDMIGAYAYAVMEGGAITRVYADAEEIAKRRAKARTDKFWKDWPVEMRKKTAVHLLETYVPTSSEQARRRQERLQPAGQPVTSGAGKAPVTVPPQEGGKAGRGQRSGPQTVDAEIVPEDQEPPNQDEQ